MASVIAVGGKRCLTVFSLPFLFTVRQFYEPGTFTWCVLLLLSTGCGPSAFYLAALLRSSRQEFDLGHQVKASHSDVTHVQHPESLLPLPATSAIDRWTL